METVLIMFKGDCAKELLDIFWGYWLDGGGDSGLYASCEEKKFEINQDWDVKQRLIELNTKRKE